MSFNTHGMSYTRVYAAWQNMKDRCRNPRHRVYARYGGRGIKVCRRWLRFENFLADMGEPPPGMTLERRDNDRGYAPGNCLWSSMTQQNRNRSNAKLCEADVREILRALARGAVQARLAEAYDVDPSEISDIKHGKIWVLSS